MCRIGTSKFAVCKFMLCPALACAGIKAFGSGDSRTSSVQTGIMDSARLRLRCHVEQYRVLELLSDSGFDMYLGFLTFSCSREVEWSRFKSSWY